jgi:hypothetical protein
MIITSCGFFQGCYSTRIMKLGPQIFSKKYTPVLIGNEIHTVQLKNDSWYFDTMRLVRGVNENMTPKIYVHSIDKRNEEIKITMALQRMKSNKLSPIIEVVDKYSSNKKLSFGVHLEDFFWMVQTNSSSQGIYFDVLIFDSYDEVWKLIKQNVYTDFGRDYYLPELDIKISVGPKAKEVVVSNF